MTTLGHLEGLPLVLACEWSHLLSPRLVPLVPKLKNSSKTLADALTSSCLFHSPMRPRGLHHPSPRFFDQLSPSRFVNGLQSSSVNIFLMTSSLLLLSKLPCICLSLIKVI